MRPVGGVAQRLPQAVHGGADAVFELNDGVVRPELLADLLPGQDFAGAAQQHDKDSERLFGEAKDLACVRKQLA